jgi:tRNA 2-thiouridine synthesizing protein A
MTELLDLKGLKCPLPVLRAKKALKSMTPGAVLEILATDPGSVKDFHAFCETTGDDMVFWSEANGVYRYTLRKKPQN